MQRGACNPFFEETASFLEVSGFCFENRMLSGPESALILAYLRETCAPYSENLVFASVKSARSVGLRTFSAPESPDRLEK
jgi:hypothetical protein